MRGTLTIRESNSQINRKAFPRPFPAEAVVFLEAGLDEWFGLKSATENFDRKSPARPSDSRLTNCCSQPLLISDKGSEDLQGPRRVEVGEPGSVRWTIECESGWPTFPP
jgi:predicted DNA-binding transcriptional regulator AlpA